jgi:DNA repair protein RecN (Recombination protein N)
MLSELSITNFAIIDQLQLRFAAGFNALTGETGAGKSIIIDALSLALGARASDELVRADAPSARVEAIFTLEEVSDEIHALLEEHGIECDDGTLILSREVVRGGRSTNRINARAVPLRVLQQLGESLVDIHGQSEHLSLKNVRTHIDYLDRFANLWDLRTRVAEKVAQIMGARRELETLLRDERELARRVDLLKFQVEEIAAAQLRVGEEETLKQDRQKLANAERLAHHADEAYSRLRSDDDDEPGALDLLGEAQRAVAQLVKLDATQAETQRQLDESLAILSDVADTLRDYGENMEFDPARLAEVEERAELIFKLKRKYGDSIEAILAFGERAAQELDAITHSSERIEELRADEEKWLRELSKLVAELSAKRKTTAEQLAKGIERELDDLRMARAKFVVDFQMQEDANGVPLNGKRYAFNATGVDRIEFLVTANPGEPPKPLAKVASGGETARLMLALKTVLSNADETPTLIFDEIDVGIGGRVGSIVGKKLWNLTVARRKVKPAHQVICITHLPQIAAYGDAHYRVDKLTTPKRTSTAVSALVGEARVGELAQMLGAVGEAGEQSAAEILRAAEKDKESLKFKIQG